MWFQRLPPLESQMCSDVKLILRVIGTSQAKRRKRVKFSPSFECDSVPEVVHFYGYSLLFSLLFQQTRRLESTQTTKSTTAERNEARLVAAPKREISSIMAVL